ncbi:EscU/YscU/HrcU family type III secretion system export apparatus switch protein [Aureibacillus halotolerans]|uniref:Flagellar biosynthesis protein n=1 Tax=Aureibacillus halotolerans TaxID=1508390 RepID=A0A4R6UBQ0_9BACI|nr:EscU/YscU/HrcU family type III secretion system export apparatus switch protein [Aureibacillus halotolerans]TDQ42409.1 flagellar biosynthesis protein [Aureibacillus halotolerans]
MENLTSSQKKAMALQYNPDKSDAPRVTAKGTGVTAESIIEIARKNNVPLHEDANLTEALQVLELNDTIPEALYSVVAELLSYVYKLNETYKKAPLEGKDNYSLEGNGRQAP